MIVDGFTFFNELDVLEIRLQTLDPVVDRFVLVEARYTFSGLPTPLVFTQNMARYKPWLSKITHIVVDDPVDTTDRRVRETYYRNCIQRGLMRCSPDDYIMVSDVDEIPYPETVGKHIGQWGMTTYYYKADLVLGCEEQIGTAACYFKNLITPHALREQRRQVNAHVLHGQCWHFSFFGDPATKIHSFGHFEYDTPYYTDPERLRRVIAERRDLFDRPYPLTLRQTRLPECLTLERYPQLFS